MERQAAHIEELAKDPEVQVELGRITTRLVENGRLEFYGTPLAREYLKKWAVKFGNGVVANEPNRFR